MLRVGIFPDGVPTWIKQGTLFEMIYDDDDSFSRDTVLGNWSTCVLYTGNLAPAMFMSYHSARPALFYNGLIFRDFCELQVKYKRTVFAAFEPIANHGLFRWDIQ